MKIVRSTSVAVLALCALIAPRLEAIQFTGSSSGVFNNPVGPSGMVTTGVGTSTFTWGDGTPFSSPPSSMIFAGTAFAGVDDGDAFDLGLLTYYNGTIAGGTQADSVDLAITLIFTAPAGLGDQSFTFPFELINTPNTTDPIASADIIKLVQQAPTTFSYLGVDYTLLLEFGTSGQGGFTTVDEFAVLEDGSASAVLRGTITSNIPGVPDGGTTALMLGLGLLGLAGVKRKLGRA